MVVSSIGYRPGEQTKASAYSGMGQRARLPTETNARFPIPIRGGHEVGIDALISRKDYAQRGIRIERALLTRMNWGPTAPSRGGGRFGFQAEPRGVGKVGLVLIWVWS